MGNALLSLFVAVTLNGYSSELLYSSYVSVFALPCCDDAFCGVCLHGCIRAVMEYWAVLGCCHNATLIHKTQLWAATLVVIGLSVLPQSQKSNSLEYVAHHHA